MKVLVFDIFSDFAHFRKPYTTTSALTFSIPPRTAILGILGAILGIESGGFGKSEHNVYFEDRKTLVGVGILNSIEKSRFNMNYLYTKSDHRAKSIRVPVEVIREPKYRIYVLSEEDVIENLEGKLENRESWFTPYLGISEFIATTEYVGAFSSTKVSTPLEVDSTVAMFESVEIKLETNKRLYRENHPIKMDGNRHVKEYVEIVYESNGGKIEVVKSDKRVKILKIDLQTHSEVVMLY